MTSAEAVVLAARSAGRQLAIAESLTGGLLAAAIVAIPGASAVLRLGVVAYQTPMKSHVIGVDPALLASRGAVDADVAIAMAEGVRVLADDRGPADVGVATTGIAGPEPQDGHAPGTVFLGFATAKARWSRALQCEGTRAQIRAATVDAALEGLLEILSESTASTGS